VPVAAIVTAGAAVDVEELARYCAERLAGYKVPVRFERLAELPRNAFGKVLRSALRDRTSLGR
jgi:acyl-CoA synthetase (AMP-forming)/AMP-acid ligase II